MEQDKDQAKFLTGVPRWMRETWYGKLVLVWLTLAGAWAAVNLLGESSVWLEAFVKGLLR